MLGPIPSTAVQWQSLIPHQGRMCLLERVDHWETRSIRCATRSHADPANPLRRDGRLSAVHLAEYGAQATAIHGALLAAQQDQSAPPGYLASLRGFRLGVDHIDQIQGELAVEAELLAESEGGCMYQFHVSADNQDLASGCVTIVHQ